VSRETALEGANLEDEPTHPEGQVLGMPAPLEAIAGGGSASQASSYAAAPKAHATGEIAHLQARLPGAERLSTDTAKSEALHIDRPFPIGSSTERLYTKNLKTLTRYSEACRREDQDETEVVPVTFADVVRDFLVREDLSAGTWKIYRASLLWQARVTASSSPTPALVREALELIPLLEDDRQVAGRPRERDSSNLIPEQDYQQLLAELQRAAIAGSLWASRASAWLMAGVLTGVRPGEWTTAAWDSSDPRTLIVTTGKAKLCEPAFARAQMDRELAERQRLGFDLRVPSSRPIPIESDFDREVVDNHLRYLVSWLTTWRDQQTTRRRGRPSKQVMAAARAVPLEQLAEAEIEDAYAAYYNGVRSAIRMACQRLWAGDKLYSLYSARSQFSANARAQHGPDRASELMGHSSPDSPATAHYGKQGAAHTRYRRLGAERIRQQGPAMSPDVREHLESRRREGGGVPSAMDAAEAEEPDGL
jgi:hypothetical protein